MTVSLKVGQALPVSLLARRRAWENDPTADTYVPTRMVATTRSSNFDADDPDAGFSMSACGSS